MILNKKRKNYLRRKHKTNFLAKKSLRSFRCIVNKSNKYDYVMVIDKWWKVLSMMSDKNINAVNKVEKAKLLWKTMWEYLTKKWLLDIVFDRNGYLYHWRVAAIADWLREWWISV